MDFKIECAFCRVELETEGALLLSPPDKGKCSQYHVCVKCYALLLNAVKEGLTIQ